MDNESRMRRLEEKAAHQERLLQVLDGVVREQELRLQQLGRQVEQLQASTKGDEAPRA